MKKQILELAKPIVDRFPKLAMTYRLLRDSAHLAEAPRDTPMGFKFNGNPAMQEGTFEPDETRLIETILPSVEVVINVGANIGYYCCIALRQRKHVVAFEPIPLNLRYLLRNIRANGWDTDIEVFPLALGDRAGIVEIYGGATGASLVKGWAGTSSRYVNLVSCSTLDTVLGSRFHEQQSLIIVDIEGAELPMLAGARSFLQREPRPVWLMEIVTAGNQPDGIRVNPNLLSTFEVFWSSGYEAWTADQHCRAVTSEEIRAIVTGGENTLAAHNFLFIEQGKRNEFLRTR